MWKVMRFTPHTHTHTHTHRNTHTLLMLMSLLTQLLAQSFIRRHYSLARLCIIHEIGISWACVACKLKKKKKENAFCTLTAKSWHCTYWDGWQLLFISVQQNLFRGWLRPLRTRTPAAKYLKKYYTEFKWTEYLICGCSLEEETLIRIKCEAMFDWD